MNLISHCERYFTPVGRILIGAFFFLAGVNKFMAIGGTAEYIESIGLPMGTFFAWAAAIFLLIAGGAMISGYKTKYAALSLSAYVVLVTVLFHGPHLWPEQQMMFMKNIAILGGLLFITAHVGKSCCQK